MRAHGPVSRVVGLGVPGEAGSSGDSLGNATLVLSAITLQTQLIWGVLEGSECDTMVTTSPMVILTASGHVTVGPPVRLDEAPGFGVAVRVPAIIVPLDPPVGVVIPRGTSLAVNRRGESPVVPLTVPINTRNIWAGGVVGYCHGNQGCHGYHGSQGGNSLSWSACVVWSETGPVL